LQVNEITKFKTFDELQVTIEKSLDLLKKKSEEYSKIIGDKLRESEEPNQDTEITELKEKLNGSNDPKKKKTMKKDKNTKWHDLGGIRVYDGIGIKAELELYFKSLDNIKSKIENLEKTKQAITELTSKGLKKDLGCLAIMRDDSPLEVVFTKSDVLKQKKLSFKSIFSVNAEPIMPIKYNIYKVVTI
jgi:hypothetical protein